MAEEFRPEDKHLPEGAPQQTDPEDPSVKKQHRSRKKKRTSPLYTVIMILLVGVMGYSGYQIVSTLVRNARADDIYSDIESNYVIVIDEPETTEAVPTEPSETAKTEPVPAGSSSAENSGESLIDETEETVPLMTLEPDPETTTVPPTTAAPRDPMGILRVDFASLKRTNSDTVAWIQGMGGMISYPVVQGRDNAYYLKHLFDGTENPNGAIFVHCENNFLQDDTTFIFGHHMRSGKMFGHLTDYESSDYYWKNQEFRLYTPEQTYTLKIIAVILSTGTERITLNYANEEAFNTHMKELAARSLHPATVPVSYGDKLVCLCTCSRHVDDGRCFIYCKLVK